MLIVSSKPHPAVNSLIPTFYGADLLSRPVHGSYLVVKSDRQGHVQHVTRDDFQVIREVLLEYVASLSTHTKMLSVLSSLVTKQTVEDQADLA